MGRLVVILVVITSLIMVVNINGVVANDVGVNWGRQSRLRLLPSNVVDMLLSDGVRKVKLHSFYENVAKAFTGSNLELMVTLPIPEVIMVNNQSNAIAFVKKNVTQLYKDHDVNVKYFMIGNEPYTITSNVTASFQNDFDTALHHVTECIRYQPSPYNQIKVSIPHAPDVLISGIKRPSQADFNGVVRQRMLNILKILNSSGSPYAVNIYPHTSILQNGFPLEFAFFDNNSTFRIQDGPNVYTNVFDFVYDSFVSALRKYGFGNLRLIVTQVGWPTDGHVYANVSTAQRFYVGFLKKIANNEGTPLHRGVPIEAYIYNLNDENAKDMSAYGPSIRHYGIYDYKGQPKFSLDLTMKGRPDAKLVPAEGVVSMPRRWCVLNTDAKLNARNRTSLILKQFERACEKNDCSKLYYGASYSNLTFEGNVSYAFNVYYQSKSQVDGACYFNGFGKITMEDPSETYGCHFQLEILSTLFIWGQGEMGNVLAKTGANAVMYANNSPDDVQVVPSVSPVLILATPFVLSSILMLWIWFIQMRNQN
ncbi:hypothetical protein ACET3Z_005867 [Daucus carota]